MVRRVYFLTLLLASFSAVYGFYILANRDELPLLSEDSVDSPFGLNVDSELEGESWPEFGVLPEDTQVVEYLPVGYNEQQQAEEEDETELLDRALRLRDLIKAKQEALLLAQQYNQLLRPEDFTESRFDDSDDSEDIELVPLPQRRAIYFVD